jgi:hypothetical protein
MLASFHQFQPPYRVLSARGYTLGKFAKREDALIALNHWDQSVAVIHDDRVIARKANKEPEARVNPPVQKRAS